MIKPRAHGGPDQTIEGVDQHPAVRQYAQMFDDLAKALGFNTCPETMYLGSWTALLEIVKKRSENLAEIRRLI